MKKILPILLWLLYPVLAFADSTSGSFFTPPTSDYSVIFLGNIFGIVDGVLHGSSQMMGNLFLVFNSAVLALGGIVITYTLIVGTMNTSQEGQFLGQKWSSIWIPLRATIGLALLIPKATGYCMMQIFIMWVVVQGVGAADRVWNAALDYLDRGGFFVVAQTSLNSTESDNTAIEDMATGESFMLQGQICMLGIQTILEAARTQQLNAAASNSGQCTEKVTSSNPTWAYFCENAVPNFLNTFDTLAAYSAGLTSVPMPNFTDGSMYTQLNGMCGTILWSPLNMAADTDNLDYVSQEEIEYLNSTRPLAVQQMYMDLINVITSMVDNDPLLVPPTGTSSSTYYNPNAVLQYGIPYLTSSSGQYTPCTGPSTDCQLWAASTSGSTQSYIFNGSEFNVALNDYNTIMIPTLNLMAENADAEASNEAHAFITNAKAWGWILSGAFFFDLVALNGSAAGGTALVDSGSGLQNSIVFSPSSILNPFSSSCGGTYGLLCTLLQGNSVPVSNVINLITGGNVSSGLQAIVTSTGHPAYTDAGSASGYGYITNASLIQLPGQPGLTTPTFSLYINIQPVVPAFTLPSANSTCGRMSLIGFCWASTFANIVWNYLFKQLIDIVLGILSNLFSYVIQNLLIIPLTAMMTMLNEGVQLLNTSQTHPIVAMAYMGTNFINYCTNLYFKLISISYLFAAIPIIGGPASGMMLLFVVPFLGAWMGVFFSIGFMDAYYVPFLPYMIFTFGSLAWYLAVMEAMVAGPIVGLGVTLPEGHDAFGKAEAAFMILLNVMLRPSMMVIGYIGGIIISYVGVYTLNAGFQQLMPFFMPPGTNGGSSWTESSAAVANSLVSPQEYMGQGSTPYVNFAALYASFFTMIIYTSMYLTVVEKSFTLIYILPDQILRWIGGQAEQYGKESSQWVESTKREIETGVKATAAASKEVAEGSAKMFAGKDPKGGAKGEADGKPS